MTKSEVEAFNQGIAAANDLLFGFQEYALVAIKPALSTRMRVLVASAFRPFRRPGGA